MSMYPNKPSVICYGCGLPLIHKVCPAHGTPVYMTPEHPAWGNRLAIQYLKTLTEVRQQADDMLKTEMGGGYVATAGKMLIDILNKS